jgi:hypothetical protein
MGGYVGSFEDKRRIARQQKEREEERKKLEDLRKKVEQGAANAGLRKFGAGTSEVRGKGACWHWFGRPLEQSQYVQN